ncbi:MAG TPA: hypothetical protein DF613_00705 [Lachnospiraceae bacterium]|nr:hypothetical protein [Lachnospiraceae bacterium]
MFKTHFGETLTVVLAIVMGIIMSLASIIVEHLDFNFSNVFKIWSMITMVILLVSIAIPYSEWSEKLMALFHLRKGSISYTLADNILPSLILNTCNTAIVSAANIFYNEAIPAEIQMEKWTQGFVHQWPVMFVISYFAAFAAVAAGKRVARRYCG